MSPHAPHILLPAQIGVYQHKYGKSIGDHSIRVIGWGVENDIPYWLVANSWNNHWGDKGLIKIRRGYNEAFIDNNFNAAIPRV